MSDPGRIPGAGDITAFVLAGGMGTRLQSVVSDRPKPMATVGGRPFLDRLFEQLVDAGIPRAVLCTGHRAEQVCRYYGKTFDGGALQLEYSVESRPMGTAGALGLAAPRCRTPFALVLNGDSYCDVSIAEMRAFHGQRRAGITIALVWKEDARAFGSVRVGEHGRIERFEEKSDATGAAWVNAGIYLMRAGWLRSLPSDHELSLERDVFAGWATLGMHGFRSRARLLDIGTPRSYAQAQAFFGEGGPQEVVAS